MRSLVCPLVLLLAAREGACGPEPLFEPHKSNVVTREGCRLPASPSWQTMTARTVELKYEFEPYDCIPSENAKRFRRNVLQHGSKADKFGYTLADTYLRRDQGAVVRGTGVFDQAGAFIAPVLAPTAGRGAAVAGPVNLAALAGVNYVPAAGGAAVVLVPIAGTVAAREKQDEKAAARSSRVADSARLSSSAT